MIKTPKREQWAHSKERKYLFESLMLTKTETILFLNNFIYEFSCVI
jgi:hypothetical protein